MKEIEKEIEKEFKTQIYLPLRREVTYVGVSCICIGIGIIAWEYIEDIDSFALAAIFIVIGLAFFFRRYILDKGFSSKGGNSISRFNLDLTIQTRINRLEGLQEICYSSRRAKKIQLMKEWLLQS